MANYFSCEGFTRRGHPGTKRLLAQRQIVKKFTILYELRDQQKTFVLMLLSESQNENDEIDGVGEVNMWGNLQSILWIHIDGQCHKILVRCHLRDMWLRNNQIPSSAVSEEFVILFFLIKLKKFFLITQPLVILFFLTFI